MIQDVTERKLRAFPNGRSTITKLKGVAAVYIVVDDLDKAIADYQRTFGLGEPERTTDKELGARLARFKGTPVVLAGGEGDWLKTRLTHFGEGPFAFVLAGATAKTDGPLVVKWLPIPGMRIGVMGGVVRTTGPRRVDTP